MEPTVPDVLGPVSLPTSPQPRAYYPWSALAPQPQRFSTPVPPLIDPTHPYASAYLGLEGRFGAGDSEDVARRIDVAKRLVRMNEDARNRNPFEWAKVPAELAGASGPPGVPPVQTAGPADVPRPKRRRHGRLFYSDMWACLALLTAGWLIQMTCFRSVQTETLAAHVRVLSDLAKECTFVPDRASTAYDDSYTHMRMYCPPEGALLALGSAWGVGLRHQSIGQQFLSAPATTWDVDGVIWLLSIIPLLAYFWCCAACLRQRVKRAHKDMVKRTRDRDDDYLCVCAV